MGQVGSNTGTIVGVDSADTNKEVRVANVIHRQVRSEGESASSVTDSTRKALDRKGKQTGAGRISWCANIKSLQPAIKPVKKVHEAVRHPEAEQGRTKRTVNHQAAEALAWCFPGLDRVSWVRKVED